MRVGVVVAVLVAGVLSGCSSASSPPATHRPSPAVDAAAPATGGAPYRDHLRVGPDAPASETFCAVAPATGTIRYRLVRGVARLVVAVHHMRADAFDGVAWAPGPVHAAEVIASITFNRRGTSVQRTLRFFHAPFYRRPGTWVGLVTNSGQVDAHAVPCSTRG
jgi:hypothetical protein